MSETHDPSQGEYVSTFEASSEQLKMAITNAKFLSMHTRLEMLHYFGSDPWIGRQIAYYLKLRDEERWQAVKLLEQGKLIESQWRQHKKGMGYGDITITKGRRKDKK